MSRAFVRESDVPQMPELPAPTSPLPPGAKNYLTPRGARRLQDELTRRLEHERPQLSAAPADDLEAKRELQVLNQRIRYLQESLRTAEMAEPPPPPHDVVRFGASVTVREAGGAETRYRLVGVDEADPEHNEVSWFAPIARALLNTRLGERVVFTTPRGPKELEVVTISYET